MTLASFKNLSPGILPQRPFSGCLLSRCFRLSCCLWPSQYHWDLALCLPAVDDREWITFAERLDALQVRNRINSWGGGGIGRRRGLKILCSQERVGSTPTRPIKKSTHGPSQTIPRHRRSVGGVGAIITVPPCRISSVTRLNYMFKSHVRQARPPIR